MTGASAGIGQATARAFASLLIRTDPDSPVWRLQYARIVARTGDLAKAVSIIRATRESWPDDALPRDA